MEKKTLKQYEFDDKEKESFAFERGFRYGIAKVLRIIEDLKDGRKSHNEKMVLKLLQIRIYDLTKHNEKKQVL